MRRRKSRREYSRRFAKSVSSGLARDARCNELRVKLRAAGPRAVYAGCFDFAVRSGSQKVEGYAANLFREIFDTWPRDRRVESTPLPNSLVNLIEEWATSNNKKPPPIIRIEKPAALLDRVDASPQLELDERGFVRGTLMRPTEDDFFYEWR